MQEGKEKSTKWEDCEGNPFCKCGLKVCRNRFFVWFLIFCLVFKLIFYEKNWKYVNRPVQIPERITNFPRSAWSLLYRPLLYKKKVTVPTVSRKKAWRVLCKVSKPAKNVRAFISIQSSTPIETHAMPATPVEADRMCLSRCGLYRYKSP